MPCDIYYYFYTVSICHFIFRLLFHFDSLLRFVTLCFIQLALIFYFSLCVSDFLIGLRHRKRLPAFSSSFKSLQKCSQVVHFSLLIHCSLTHVSFRKSRKFADYVLNWLISLGKKWNKNFPKIVLREEFDSINKTEKAKQQTRLGRDWQCMWEGVRVRLGEAFDADALKFFSSLLLHAWIIENSKWFLNGKTDSCLGYSPSLPLSLFLSPFPTLFALSRDFRNSQ